MVWGWRQDKIHVRKASGSGIYVIMTVCSSLRFVKLCLVSNLIFFSFVVRFDGFVSFRFVSFIFDSFVLFLFNATVSLYSFCGFLLFYGVVVFGVVVVGVGDGKIQARKASRVFFFFLPFFYPFFFRFRVHFVRFDDFCFALFIMAVPL